MSEQVPLARGGEPPGKRRAVIITGLSGAGKTNALKAFEDAGYYCIDNLPPGMIRNVSPRSREEGRRRKSGRGGRRRHRGSRYFDEE